MKLSLDLMVGGAMEDEVLLCLDLPKMANMVDPIRSGKLVVFRYSKSIRTHCALIKRDTKSVCPMA